MRLVSSDMIPLIDKYAQEYLKIPTRTLMERAGDAVASCVREIASVGSRIAVFAGKGNNGGDGYAAAVKLAPDYSVTVYDVFLSGQRSDAGRYWLEQAKLGGVNILPLPSDIDALLCNFDIAVDAVFGTGFRGEYPEIAVRIAEAVNSSDVKAVAIDVPIGVNADSGECEKFALECCATVELSYVKVGLVSYPAREKLGRLIYCDIGLDIPEIHKEFDFNSFYTDGELFSQLLPTRDKNSNKGSFGKVLMLCGSDKYRGAAHLAAEAALRGGAGYVIFSGERELCAELRMKFPEIIYREESISDIEGICDTSRGAVTLIGCGCGTSECLARLTEFLIRTEGEPLIIDADAINSLAMYSSLDVFYEKRRKIILTPHPLEFSRLIGESVETVNSSRLEVARSFAKKYGVTLLLKGAATVICDESKTYINSSGSSALAKAGSGDVLAGLIAALTAQAPNRPMEMCASAAYLHGAAADELAKELSEYGVIPSDIPKKAAHIISTIKNSVMLG